MRFPYQESNIMSLDWGQVQPQLTVKQQAAYSKKSTRPPSFTPDYLRPGSPQRPPQITKPSYLSTFSSPDSFSVATSTTPTYGAAGGGIDPVHSTTKLPSTLEQQQQVERRLLGELRSKRIVEEREEWSTHPTLRLGRRVGDDEILPTSVHHHHVVCSLLFTHSHLA